MSDRTQPTPPVGQPRQEWLRIGYAAPGAASRGRSAAWRRAIRRYWAPYLFISPFFILFAIFGLFPPLYGLFLSFYRWDALTPRVFVGLRNYELAITDALFWHALLNNLTLLLIATVPGLTLSLILAFFLNNAIRRGRDFYLATYFSPTVTSSAALALVFGLLYGREFGILNAGLRALHLPAVDWLHDPIAMKAALAMLLIWRYLGWNTVIYLAGLQAIPHDYYEAARVDGASTRHLFWHISLPLLRPALLFTTVTSTIGILQLFNEPYLLVGPTGGSDYSLLTMTMYLYNNAFTYLKFGYASALSYLMFAFIFGASLLNLLLVGRKQWGEV